jgi:hypothetical protein
LSSWESPSPRSYRESSLFRQRLWTPQATQDEQDKQAAEAAHQDHAQLEIFEAFWQDDIGKGALSFDFPDPVFGVTRSFSFTAGFTIQSVAAIDYYLIPMSIETEAIV